MRSWLLSLVLGAASLGLLSLTPSQAEAQRWWRWARPYYGSYYYYPGYTSSFYYGYPAYSYYAGPTYYPGYSSYYYPGYSSYYYPGYATSYYRPVYPTYYSAPGFYGYYLGY